MAAPPTFQPIARALVSTLRTNSTLKAELTGFHEAIAPNKAEFPYLTYDLYGSTSKSYCSFGKRSNNETMRSIIASSAFNVSVFMLFALQALKHSVLTTSLHFVRFNHIRGGQVIVFFEYAPLT